MFKSIQFVRYLGYNFTTKLNEYTFELIDTDFSCVVFGAEGARVVAEAGAVIQEYSKRKLNVAANLIRAFQFMKETYGWSIAQQIKLAEQYNPLFTPELKQELDKYMVLL